MGFIKNPFLVTKWVPTKEAVKINQYLLINIYLKQMNHEINNSIEEKNYVNHVYEGKK